MTKNSTSWNDLALKKSQTVILSDDKKPCAKTPKYTDASLSFPQACF